MDISDYDTNIITINGIKSIAFQVYEPNSDHLHSFPSIVSETDNALHDDGRIFYFDTVRRALWHFYFTDKDASSNEQEDDDGLGSEVDFAGASLVLVEQGAFEPVNLFKGRTPAQASAANTPTTATPNNPTLEQPTRSVTAPYPTDADKIVSVSTMSNRSSSTTVKDAYERFITALLSTTSTSFCRRMGAIPLNHCTVLLDPKATRHISARHAGTRGSAIMGTFRTYLTTTGSLVIGLSLTASEGIIPLSEAPGAGQPAFATQVIAAPFGVLGTYQGLSTGMFTDALSQTPDTRLWRPRQDDARSSQWREMCSSILRARGVPSEFLEDCPWIALQLARRKPGDQSTNGLATPLSSSSPVISWPAALCFRKRALDYDMETSGGDERLAFSEETSDILNEVRQWFLSGNERDESILLRRKAREAAANKETQPPATNIQQPNGQSPADPRRAANAAAAGTVYPTPPDGVQNPTAATPAAMLEVSLSSPGGPPSMTVPVEADIPMGNTNIVGEPEQPEHWEAPSGKRERGDSFNDTDNLFGDMGPDMFGGDADITDADFSFFDEQPEDGDLDLTDMPDLPMPNPPAAPAGGSPVRAPPPKPLSRENSKEKMPPPSSPAFVKPEPRHARSNQVDETKQAESSGKPTGTKRDLSPFDPDTVFKKVRASLSQSQVTNGISSRKGSIYDSVEFDPILPLANKKYEAGGRFDCSTLAPRSQVNQGKPPTTDYLKRHGRQNRKASRVLDPTIPLIQSFSGVLGINNFQGSPEKLDEAQSDADDVSMDSDLDDTPELTEDAASPFKGSTKRFNGEDDVVSHVTSLRDAESVVDESDPSLALELPRIAKAEAPSVTVTKFFDSLEPTNTEVILTDEEIITVAQILTEQAVSGNLQLRGARLGADQTRHAAETRRHLAVLAHGLAADLRECLPSALAPLNSCTLKKVIEVADIPLYGTSNRFQPRPVPSRDQPNEPPPKLFSIPVPHLEMKRMDTKLSILPSSVPFWETLGLGPSPGQKNVTAVCVFPGAEGMDDFASAFLEQTRHTYEFLKLGSFDLLTNETHGITGGLLPWDVSASMTPLSADGPFNFSVLHERMQGLNQSLLATDASDKNFVVFFAYSPAYSDSIVETCSAFQQLFEMHKKSLSEKKKKPSNELVLQLIPTLSLTSVLGPSSTNAEELIRLSVETYDRCTLFGGPMPAPAIVLEQTMPRSIDFRLSNTGSSSLMHENTCIHIAYAQSVDERWITAAWTDNRGSQQMTASYNLGRKGKPLSCALNDVMHEIWETTHDLISRWKVHWRVIITKSGHMDQNEMDFWAALADTESMATVSLTLIAVDTNPSLQLLPPCVRVAGGPSGPLYTAPGYTTPVSTPQPPIVSPDQISTPATPIKEANATGVPTPGAADGSAEPAEGDAILVDVTDQTWGVVLSHRLSTSSSPGDLTSALASGYLVKRGGTNTEDPPVVMEVNILRNDANPRAHEQLMREMLSYFRGLGTLARARSIVDRETDVRPWHVAAAEKGVEALYLLM